MQLLVHREVLVLVLQAGAEQPELLVDPRPLGGRLQQPARLIEHMGGAEHRLALGLQGEQPLLDGPQLLHAQGLERHIGRLVADELRLDHRPSDRDARRLGEGRHGSGSHGAGDHAQTGASAQHSTSALRT